MIRSIRRLGEGDCGSVGSTVKKKQVVTWEVSNTTMRTWPRRITKEQTIFREVPRGIFLCVRGEPRLLKPRSFPFSSGLTMVYNIKWIIPKLRNPTRLWNIASSITFAAVGIFSKIFIGKHFPANSYFQFKSNVKYFIWLSSIWIPYLSRMVQQNHHLQQTHPPEGLGLSTQKCASYYSFKSSQLLRWPRYMGWVYCILSFSFFHYYLYYFLRKIATVCRSFCRPSLSDRSMFRSWLLIELPSVFF